MNDLIERLRLGDGTSADHELLLEAADALEALAQPEQEPVAWKEDDEVQCPVCKDKGFPWPKCGHITYIERTPPQRTWVGLTDEERQDIALEVPIDAVFITEAKLKELNK